MKPESGSRRRRPLGRRFLVEWLAIGCLGVAAICAGVFWQTTASVDRLIYDHLLGVRHLALDPDIVVVQIDNASVDRLGRWPWPRSVHARLLDELARAAGRGGLRRAVHRSFPDDAELGQALARVPAWLPVLLSPEAADGTREVSPPVPELAARLAGTGHINFEVDPDGIVRSVALAESDGRHDWPQLMLSVARALDASAGGAGQGALDAASAASAASSIAASTASTASTSASTASTSPAAAAPAASASAVASRLVKAALPAPGRYLIPFSRSTLDYPAYSLSDVLAGKVPEAALRGKIVVVGVTAAGLYDRFATPISGDFGTLPGVYLHASVLDMLLTGRAITLASPGWLLLASLPVLAALLTGILLLSPLRAAAGGLADRAGGGRQRRAAVRRALLGFARARHPRPDRGLPAVELAAAGDDHDLPARRARAARRRAAPAARGAARSGPARRVRRRRAGAADEPDGAGRAPRAGHEAFRVGQPGQHARADLRDRREGHGADRQPRGQALLRPGRRQRAGGALAAGALGALEFVKTVAHPEREPELRAAWPAALDPTRGEAPALLISGLEVRDADGLDHLLRYAPCTNAEGRAIGWIAGLVDVTALHAAERQREEALHLLSHDMRSPQASILALVQIERQRGDASAPQRELFGRIERHAQRALTLADEFVQLARAESQTYRIDTASFADLLIDASDEVWPQAQAKRIRIDTALDGEPYWIGADRSLMARALVNLLNNAVKYSPADTLISCSFATEEGPPRVTCTIRDQGYGIAPEDQAHLFERFRRFHASERPEVSGTGLGMVFVKTVVTRHGGSIAVDSAVGVGTAISITLPRLDEPAA
ncbi:CHASE2 domain-containing protein [Burkholderia gladioli]|uniref:CHASE2 domain-containing protein n=1 Tax=Burkholderia gladioli TaxID=28095 RepID=UPI0037097DD1